MHKLLRLNKLFIKNADDSYSVIPTSELSAYIKNMNNSLENLYKQVNNNGTIEYELYQKNEIFSIPKFKKEFSLWKILKWE